MRLWMLADCSSCPEDEFCEPDAENDWKSYKGDNKKNDLQWTSGLGSETKMELLEEIEGAMPLGKDQKV